MHLVAKSVSRRPRRVCARRNTVHNLYFTVKFGNVYMKLQSADLEFVYLALAQIVSGKSCKGMYAGSCAVQIYYLCFAVA